MFCPNCGKEVQAEARFCENCGAAVVQASSADQQHAQAPPGYQAPPPQYQAPPPYYGPQAPYGAPGYGLPTKSSGLAAILAFLIPGLGHIYLGKITEGIIFMILAVAIWVLAGFAIVVSLLIFGILGFVIGLILYFIFWAWQIYDAYNKANEYNAAVQRTGRAPW